MKNSSSIPGWVTGFAVAVVVLTWFLIIVGGIVHGTGSSLACPDWPTCYGTFFPEMTGGVFFEHSHRIVAATVGFLSICLCVFLLWKGRGALRAAGVGAVLLVIFQGVLGGITVLYRLPTAVSTAHLATSMLFLALMVWIAFRSRLSAVNSGSPGAWLSLKGVLSLAAASVYLQIVLGGLVRHTGAGLACLDIPFCHGSLWPPGAPPIVKLHMLHRIAAIGVALLVGIASYRFYRVFSGQSCRFLALSVPLLVVLQVCLGLLSIHGMLPLFPVTAHLAVAALIWVNMLLMILVSRTPSLGASRKPAMETHAYLLRSNV